MSEPVAADLDNNSIPLNEEDCAVVFQADGTLNVYVPSRQEGEAITPQMLYAILVQELLKDQFMLKVLTDRVISSGIIGTSNNEAPTNA